MKRILLILILTSISGFSNAQSVVINKLFNTGTASEDVVELLVVTNNLDMRGMIIKDYTANMDSDGGGIYTFSNNTLWSSVRSGTIIVLRENNSANDVVINNSDFNLDIGLNNATYFTNGGGSFDIAATDMVMIKSAGSSTSDVAGSIHVLAAGTAGYNFTASANPKIRATSTVGTNQFVYVNNATQSLVDYNGIGATGAATGLTLGSGNNTNNIAYINSLRLAVLPISLTTFTAKPINETILLNWKTISEKNNKYFEVQRSADGKSYTSITTLDGAGNSDTEKSYSFTDENPYAGTNYYKLIQYDIDGKSTPKIISVDSNLDKAQVFVSSSGSSVDLNITSPNSAKATLYLYDLEGNRISEKAFGLSKGMNTFSFAEALSPGVYFVSLITAEATVNTKFAKIN